MSREASCTELLPRVGVLIGLVKMPRTKTNVTPPFLPFTTHLCRKCPQHPKESALMLTLLAIIPHTNHFRDMLQQISRQH